MQSILQERRSSQNSVIIQKKKKFFLDCLRHLYGRKTDSNSSKDMQKDKASRQMCVDIKQ